MKTLVLAVTLSLAVSGVLFAQQAADVPTVQQKLEKIIFPTVQFQDATIQQALEYLRIKSRDLDTITEAPGQKGVSFVVKMDGTTPAPISLDLKNVPLLEALRYCTELSGLKYRVEAHAVLVAPVFVETPIPPAATPPPVVGNADQIIFPTVQFAGATIAEAAEYIRVKSRDLDPAKQGVNIVVKPGGPDTKITLDLRNIPVSHAIAYIAELSGHQLTADGHAYLLTPLKAK
ncbi:MAG: hypothetical protein ACKVY0_02135 [Prosthecobacter sp.]|uniref:hypothetical protein n=1 Tax=Prosthecobacter sp. TaxID=1965333 RepID=UPI0038FF9662